MNKNSFVLLLPAMLLCGSALIAAPVQADPEHHGPGWHDEDRNDDRDNRDEHHDKYRHFGHQGHDQWERHSFRSSDRTVIQQYYAGRHWGHCPPGLARKNNGCMPPGQYRRFVQGEYLPTTVVYQPVPRDLYTQLAPAPYGTQYVVANNNLMLMSNRDRQILDVINLFSNAR